jgi:Holliday junction DNA helicase RuvB
MEDYTIDIMIGSGTGSTSVRMDIPRFTLIGATTRLSSLSSPLRDRFGNVMKLDFYEPADLAKIVKRSFVILDCHEISDDAILAIAHRSRGTPRIANRYVKILRDYATIGKSIESRADCEAIFESFGVDAYGLDILDRKLLSHLIDTFHSKPVGLSTLASVIGEEVATIEDVVEPYLLQIGLIERTPRGRQITMKGEEYMRELKIINSKL